MTRHSRVLKPLEVVSRDKRRVIGKGLNGLMSDDEKTALKEGCAAFRVSWRRYYSKRLLTPKGHVVEAHVRRFEDAFGICGVLEKGAWEAFMCRANCATRRHGICAAQRPATKPTSFITTRACSHWPLSAVLEKDSAGKRKAREADAAAGG